MKNNNILKWQEFKISDIFTIKKGERLIEANRIVGTIPLITASSYKNGITGMIDYEYFKDSKKIFKNKITVDMFGNVFYHNYKYFSDDNIHTLILKDKFKIELNSYMSFFIVTILKKLSMKYSFGRQIRLYRLESELIQLPILKKDVPNWEYMEYYIYNLAKKTTYSKIINKPKKILKLNSVTWKEFPIIYNKKLKTGLFNFSVGTDKDKVLQFLQDDENSKVYEISNTAFNNGINEIYPSKKYNNKNTITLGTRGNDFKAFYHEYDVIPVVRVINLKSVNFNLNKYLALFLCTIFNKSSTKFSYGRFLSGKNILKENILLPVDKNNNPNWSFMENYIKSLPYSSNI